MSSTKPEKFIFTFDDFEKGLMLAGLVSPANITDLEEIEVLENYEKELHNNKGKLYFKRVVLAAKIASELSQEITFGRIKFQKLVYLCEHVSRMNLESLYTKQAAGPFDNKFMHTIEKEFKRQNWFAVEKIKDGKFVRSKYVPLPDHLNYKKYYESYFDEELEKINHVINLFRTSRTDKTEIAATLLACYLELKSNKELITEKRILELFYAWSERKSQYNEKMVISIWKWMNEQGLVTG